MKIHPDKTGGVVLDTREKELLEVFQLAVLEDGHDTAEAAYWLLPLSKGIDPKFFDWLVTGDLDLLRQ